MLWARQLGILLVCSGTITAHAAPGDLDTVFSGDGLLTTTVSTGSEEVNAALVQPDGKLVVAGSSGNSKFMVIRYNTDGTLDTTFDADGIALIDTDATASSEYAKDIALQPDGKLVIVGYTYPTSSFIVVRLNSNGSLDASFDGDGVYTLANAGGAYAIAVLPDGKIFAAGDSNIVRLNTNGTLDTSFDGDGIRAASGYNAYCRSLAVLPDGKLVASNPSNGVVRLNADGSVDTTFGNNGRASTSITTAEPYDLAMQPDGKFLLAGYEVSYPYTLAVQRFNTDGSIDGTFGIGGVASGPTPPAGGSGDQAFGVATQSDGKVIAVGFRNSTPVPPKTEGYDFLITRFLSNGSLDTGFAGAGTKVIDIANYGQLTAAAVDASGRIYAAGDLQNPSADVFVARLAGDAFDTLPDAVSFVDLADVEPGEYVTSNAVSVSGLSAGAQVPVRVSGGEYRINGGAFRTTTAFVQNGDSIVVRHAASSELLTAVDTTLTFGGMVYQNSPANFYGTTAADTFTSTTAAPDTTPNAFAFTAQNNVTVSSVRTSNTVTITGINTAVPITVTGGFYSIGCNAAFTANAGTILKNQTVCVRHTASGQFSTPVNTVLDVGGVQATFTSTTEAQDMLPNDFSFAPVSNVAPGTPQTSAPATIIGINTATPVSVTNGEYSIGCGGSYVSSAGAITNGQSVCVRHTSASGFSAATTTTLAIGGAQATFTSTTVAQDTAPGAFTFTTRVNVARNAVVISNAVTITGINTATAITVTDGEYSVGCNDSFVATAGIINNGQTVCVRHVSANGFSASTVTTLDIGGVRSTFTSTTVPPDIAPVPFSFIPKTGVEPGMPVISNAVTVLGIDAPAAVIVTDGEYSVGCSGTFTSAVGNVSAGETVCVRHTASPNFETTMTTSLSIGTESAVFSSTTRTAQVSGSSSSGGGEAEKDSGGAGSFDVLLLLSVSAGLLRARWRRIA